jgi:hypothetical protein
MSPSCLPPTTISGATTLSSRVNWTSYVWFICPISHTNAKSLSRTFLQLDRFQLSTINIVVLRADFLLVLSAEYSTILDATKRNDDEP